MNSSNLDGNLLVLVITTNGNIDYGYACELIRKNQCQIGVHLKLLSELGKEGVICIKREWILSGD